MTSSGCRVRVCRDCCCGTASKHPGVDHDGLLDRLTRRVAGRAEVDVTGCLLACERSNVVVVSPSSDGRAAGGRPVWLKEVLAASVVDAVGEWVMRGGPGIAPLPGPLARHHTRSPAAGGGMLDEAMLR